MLYRNGHLLNAKTRLTLCNSLLQPHIDYCCSAWYSALNKKYKDKLCTFQRKMARFCLFLGPRDHVGMCELSSLSWLSVPNRVNYFKALHVFKIVNNKSVAYLNGMFTSTSDVHGYGTRSARDGKLYVPQVSSTQYQSTFCFTALQFWNSLPIQIRSCPTLGTFRAQVGNYLLLNQ